MCRGQDQFVNRHKHDANYGDKSGRAFKPPRTEPRGWCTQNTRDEHKNTCKDNNPRQHRNARQEPNTCNSDSRVDNYHHSSHRPRLAHRPQQLIHEAIIAKNPSLTSARGFSVIVSLSVRSAIRRGRINATSMNSSKNQGKQAQDLIQHIKPLSRLLRRDNTISNTDSQQSCNNTINRLTALRRQRSPLSAVSGENVILHVQVPP
nr:MAG TPA: hypothetical protein [Caudoviricetes sp.]